MTMNVKVLLPAGQIPLHSKVSKKTGEKLYTLHETLTVYKESGECQKIKEDDVRYMIDGDGNIVAVAFTKELMWHTNVRSLSYWINNLLEGVSQ